MIQQIPQSHPVIIDAKRGDIGNTSNMQARYIFDVLGADATTLHPYMGDDSLTPFFEYRDKYHFVLGLTSNESYNCIVGFSGKIIDKENLKSRKKNSSNILLIHGELDTIVPSTHLLEAKDFFIRNNVNIETYLIKNSGHNIPIEASSIALNYILKKI